jgi:hypothetical protein
MREIRNAYKIYVGKPEGKSPLRRHRHEWNVNIIMDLGEVGWEIVEWIHLTDLAFQGLFFMELRGITPV